MVALRRCYRDGGRVPSVADDTPAPVVPAETPQQAPAPEPASPLTQRLREAEFAEKLQQFSPKQREWLKAHPDAPGKWDMLARAHDDAMRSGAALDSEDYFARLEQVLKEDHTPVESGHAPLPQGLANVLPSPAEFARRAEERAAASAEAPRGPSVPYGMPPSRDIPAPNGRAPSTTAVTLSPEERDFARDLGLSETEYARNKQRMHYLKAMGAIQDGRE